MGKEVTLQALDLLVAVVRELGPENRIDFRAKSWQGSWLISPQFRCQVAKLLHGRDDLFAFSLELADRFDVQSQPLVGMAHYDVAIVSD